MSVYEYVTAPARIIDGPQTVHLVLQVGWMPERTICGVTVDDRWLPGDETTSGIAATCGRCRRIYRGA